MLANIYKTGEKYGTCSSRNLNVSNIRLITALCIYPRLYYPISIIRNLMNDFPNQKAGILYDIGCHLEAHVTKVSAFLLDCMP
jgi:hypothetical protein